MHKVGLTCVLVILVGCATTKTPTRTQLEIREFQTRSFDTPDALAVLKALVNVLQDEGYTIKVANTELGILSATKEVDVESTIRSFLSKLFRDENARWDKNSIIDATANVSKVGDLCRVRVTFQIKQMDNKGDVVYVRQIEEVEHYTNFFAKVHKGIFIDVEQGL